ncbi:MAG: Gmad2 immunoglobulin-like domain-containing protein [Patescibacteria group bacterium]|nr:Gmad2 immunoglobulin-like domain-containing protein [Patescibacteria group bacterium]
MKKNILITILAILALGLAGYTAFLSYQEKNKPAVPVITQTPVQNNKLNNDSLNSSNIHITAPIQGDTISSPVKITGEVRVFENQFAIRVKDGNGKVLVEEPAMGENGDAGQFNSFEKEIDYPKSTTDSGTIEVFDYSAKDGSEIDKVTIPVKFK